MSALPPATPVLVGVASLTHRPDDGPEPDLLDFLVTAARSAGDDAGAPGLLAGLGWIGVEKGAWAHPDPGRVVAGALGAAGARTVLGEVGVLQQEVIGRACQAVAEGARAALVVGGETAHGSTAGAAGAVVEARSAESEPDEHLSTDDLGVSAVEIGARFYDPPTVYAVLESAWAASQGWAPEEHRKRLGELWADFAAVAAANPDAWSRARLPADAIVEPGAGNRMVASPYTKRCCSNLRVNQAAALLVTTVEGARAAGVAEDRWVFPLGSAVANHTVPVVQRPDLARSANARAAGGAALAAAGLSRVGAADVQHLDLYSCFPAAVQIAAGELGIDPGRRLTVTGGMAFAGGPLNSYVLHSTAVMAEVLRADPGARGLVTSVSGFLTKYGAGVWSTRPGADGSWRHQDVTAEAAAVEEPRPDAPAADVAGPLRVLGSTVAHARDGGRRTFAVAESADGVRTVVTADGGDAAEAPAVGSLVRP